MSFASLSFVFFLPVVLGLYYALRFSYKVQNYLLIVASYVFYASWDWRFAFLMVWITLFDFSCAILMSRAPPQRRKYFLAASIVSNLSLLFTFKYLAFFQTSTLALLSTLHMSSSWPVIHLILPIGLSFIVFESMSYTIDVYRGEMQADFRLSSYALFISFFPKLVAGPIIRAHTLLNQIEGPRTVDRRLLVSGAWSIVIGFFLKLVIANNLSPTVDRLFGSTTPLSGLSAVLGIYGFAFQIFADFAGYSSIAIGIAALLGFRLPINFRQPYLVGDPQAFWRHWHISLSTWLKDYLYVSLGGNRRGVFATYRNLFITMLLGGLWHGASWTFVLWGAYHGGLLVVHRLTSRFWAFSKQTLATTTVSAIIMFQLTCVGWLLFRARSLAEVSRFARAIATGWTVPLAGAGPLINLVAGAGIAVIGYQCLQRRYGDDFIATSRSIAVQRFAFLAAYVSILWFGDFGVKTFIYFQF